jgi:hypothetical protein
MTKTRHPGDVAFYRHRETKTESLNLRIAPETKRRLEILAAIEGRTLSAYTSQTLTSWCDDHIPVMIWHVGTNGGKIGIYSSSANVWIYTDTMAKAEELAKKMNIETGGAA